ncbi:hypothetical protein [Pararhizobium antarcticum]|uniref:Uncharacterized protein n=1 Tax=Pararhizobium antarcticum TaxID=1798805 RepID=A0A657LUH6_9HYPH|nr:hypothetical protein [Pararhizobium antarcticum]OJF98737.1 hypothetical protein AX760_01480 [Pararhizobium antarcticum]OJF98875.1 hypothetical protein AX760_02330 [Pararhizobium antarcticum]OJF99158.1 hypothetical protein AX761_11910 [Rhizobium sp. 58]
MNQRDDINTWAIYRAQEILGREGMDLAKSARSFDHKAIRENGMLLARAIAASLIEASATMPK